MQQYAAPKYFDMEMMRLFEKARKFYQGPRHLLAYGHVLALQVGLALLTREDYRL